MRSASSMSTNRTVCPASVLSARTARNVMALPLSWRAGTRSLWVGFRAGQMTWREDRRGGRPLMADKEKPQLLEKEKPPRALTAVKGADGLLRCPWPGQDPLYLAYHDEEW